MGWLCLLRGNRATSGDILCCHIWWEESCWHPVGGGQGCRSASLDVRNTPMLQRMVSTRMIEGWGRDTLFQSFRWCICGIETITIPLPPCCSCVKGDSMRKNALYKWWLPSRVIELSRVFSNFTFLPNFLHHSHRTLPTMQIWTCCFSP
jgi:hypothetical protein